MPEKEINILECILHEKARNEAVKWLSKRGNPVDRIIITDYGHGDFTYSIIDTQFYKAVLNNDGTYLNI